MAVFTIYPDGDGHLTSLSLNQQASPALAWAEARAGTWSVQEFYTNTTIETQYTFLDSSGEYYVYLTRGYLLFDTSVLGGAEVDSASVFLKVQNINNPSYDQVIIDFSPTTTTSPVGTDEWNNFGTNNYAQATISGTGYKEFTLNASGISYIDPSGDTFFGIVHIYDYNGTNVSSDLFNDMDYYSIEQTGTSDDPYLEVVTVDGGGTGFFLMF